MTPLVLNKFWHRRICEAALLMSAIVIALYGWAFFADVKSISAALLVTTPAAILAAATALMSFVLYLWVPKKQLFQATLVVYLLLALTAGTLIVTTGGTASPFIAVWMLVAVFAGIFGIWGLLPMLIAVNAYLVLQYISPGLSREAIIAIAFGGELPLVASYIIWHRKAAANTTTGDRAYRALETELSEVAGKSEVVINAIGDGVLAIDSQGVIQLINPAAQRLLGWGKQDATTLNYKSVLQLLTNKDEAPQTGSDPVEQVLNTNQQIRTNDFKLTTKNGKKLLASIVVSPVGEVGAGVIVVFRDITKEKSEEREQAEFISTASHEMRTPVASIEGYLGLALNPATAQIDEKARDFIQKAHESAQHLGRLFQDLLDVSKAEDGRLSNNPKVVDITVFVGEIAEGLRTKATEKGLQLTYKPTADGGGGERRLTPVYYVNLDNDHIREITNNLIENAIKYTPSGEVIVDVTGDNEHVTISITDSGIGIPTEDMPHLFQKFYRVDNTDTRQIGGTGLGLYLCRRLAETLGGRIWADSEYKKGSIFYVELPRIDNQEAQRLIDTATREAAEIAQSAPTPEIPVTTTPQPETVSQQSEVPVQATSVPRGQALTPEQIAQYVAQQQALIAQQQAAVQPQDIPQPQLVVQQPEPIYVQPIVPQTQYSQPPQNPAPQPVNTPLSSIEQNPSAYTQVTPGRTQGVAIPVRDYQTPPQ